MFGHLDLSFGQNPVDRYYQCSLCHALGKNYGIMSRFLTNYDMTLLLTLPLAISKDSILSNHCRCPLMKKVMVASPDHPLLRFCASATIILVSEKIQDDLYDHDHYYPINVLSWINKKRAQAEVLMKSLGFNSSLVTAAFQRHRLLEKEEKASLNILTEPTASVMGHLYAHTAQLIDQSNLELDLYHIGHSLGKIIYLLDALCDFEEDQEKGAFNPLSKCLSASNSKPNEPRSIDWDLSYEALSLIEQSLQKIITCVQSLPKNDYICELLINRLTEKIKPYLEGRMSKTENITSSFWTIIDAKMSLPFALSSTPAMAASGPHDVGGRCCESIVTLAILYFIFKLIFKSVCGSQSSGCCFSGRPKTVTVDHGGCTGTKTYQRDSCSGKYREDRCC